MSKPHSLNKYRLSFPEDEKDHKWLPILLDAYALIDEGVDKAVKKAKRDLACSKGCGECCKAHRDIPIYPLELVGIYWYTVKHLKDVNRQRLKNHLLNFKRKTHCPFLIDFSCCIHPMRPIACRQFNVFGRACAEGEDPFYTRRNDVLTPIKEYSDKAFYIMMPFYNIVDDKSKKSAINKGLLHGYAKILQRLNWHDLLQQINDFDSKNIMLR